MYIDYTEVEDFVKRKQRELSVDIKILKLKDKIQDSEGDIASSIKLDTIFVTGLPDNCNENKLRLALEEYGDINEIRIPIDRRAGKQRNIAFVRFRKEKYAK